MSDVSRAPRDARAIRRRGNAAKLIRGAIAAARRLAGGRESGGGIGLLLPRDATARDLGAAANRMAWYLGGEGRDPGAPGFEILAPPHLLGSAPEAPPTERSYLAAAPPFRIVDRSALARGRYDNLALWRWTDVADPGVLRRLARVSIVDSEFYRGFENAAYRALYLATCDRGAQARLARLSEQNFARLCARHGGGARAFVLGTGPSLDEALGIDTSGAAVVSCNSVVKNRAYMDRFKPAVVCFADPLFHFSPCEYAAAFRDDLLAAAAAYPDLFLATRRDAMGLLLRHHPALEDRLIGVGTGRADWGAPAPGRLEVRATDNVLTLLMLPFAAALARREVVVCGSDGRKPEERYFWRHNPAVQYEGLMATAFATHPSLFRDMDYEAYYDLHCRVLEEQLAAFEAGGLAFASATTSYIPALVRRRAAR